MSPQRETRISKFLSLVLRHAPERIGIDIDPQGWTDVEQLLEKSAANGLSFTRKELEYVVQHSPKQRYAFDETGERIRANQGHSIPVELDLPAQTPPAVLYHGTSHNRVESVLSEGLKKMQRHHVHLSADVETAYAVGARYGKPVVLEVDTQALHQAGTSFYRSENGVWLVDAVPPEYLRLHDT